MHAIEKGTAETASEGISSYIHGDTQVDIVSHIKSSKVLLIDAIAVLQSMNKH